MDLNHRQLFKRFGLATSPGLDFNPTIPCGPFKKMFCKANSTGVEIC
jgi:hypothetical protein